jgi:hypothetical protein
MRMLIAICATLTAVLAGPGDAISQTTATLPSLQIVTAVAPLPDEFRATATVLGYVPGRPGLSTLREGDGPYICLADDPSDERFHVACYHRSLEPFMARGRELRAGGATQQEVDSIRNAEAVAGTLSMPASPAALYSLTGTHEDVDQTSGAIRGARPLYVVYIPFATAESTGLPVRPQENSPWLMNPGTPKAHIMFVPTM